MKKTERGFSYYEFIDKNGVECSLQKSSLAFEDCIWLGCDGIHMANARMHLTQDMVRDLLPYLQKFAETGELE